LKILISKECVAVKNKNRFVATSIRIKIMRYNNNNFFARIFQECSHEKPFETDKPPKDQAGFTVSAAIHKKGNHF
jgi:hypothetical protein